ncbi:MAG: hypothetical protein MUP74_00455 [Desulfobacterales bacterium]|nr:hypothetical protein [Desulfobacterales bacterium]
MIRKASCIPIRFDSFAVDSQRGDPAAVRDYLQHRATFLLRILENPILQEHGNFTELLRAVFHLRDELLNRADLVQLTAADRQHLEVDILRVYRLLTVEWLGYVHYLKDNYAYLLSLAMRMNPFDPESDAAVKEA